MYQGVLESGTKLFKGPNQLDMKLDSGLQIVGRHQITLNATATSQVLTLELNLATSIYFYTHIIIVKSIIIFVIIISIILVNNLPVLL